MKKIKAFLSIGDPTSIQENILEVEDNATEDEIEKEVLEWANQYIDFWWESVSK